MTVHKEKRSFTGMMWMAFLLSAIVILTGSCLRNNSQKIDNILSDDPANIRFRLHEIQERGKLVAVCDFNPTDYFVYRGELMGYQYERLKIFADFLGVDLEIKVIHDLNRAFRELNDDKVDLVAMGLTITKERSKKVRFANPFMETRQMLVQHKPKNWRKMSTWDEIERNLIRNPLDLAGKTIYVQSGSVYLNRLKNLSEEIGGQIEIVEDEERGVEQLIDAVAKGEIEFTICDENLALLYEKYYPDIDVKTPVSFPQNVAWAVKKSSDSLLMAINYWQGEFNKTLTSRYLFDKYFNNPVYGYSAKSEFINSNGSRISEYDDLIKDIGTKYELDWRLLASLIYQESQFHPEVKSWSGAFGLMQLMPNTAAIYGVDSASSAADQIEAGVKYIRALDKELPEDISDPEERIKFILASYNMGIAHVYDARRLAEKNGRDPNIWKNNVDYYILNKSNPKYYQDSVVRYGYARGEETFNFVREVLERYEHYKNVIVD